MRNVPTLLRRELNAYFASIVGYIVMVFFLVVMGVTFGVIVNFLMQGPTQFTATKIMFSMFWLPSLFIVPAITMRLLAEEKRSGAIEMLMTAPVTELEVVLAKWLGAVALYSLMWGFTALYVLILGYFSRGLGTLDYGPVAAGYVGVLVVGQFLIAIGVLASSVTKNQVVAALMAFAALFLFLVVVGLWLPWMVKEPELAKFIKAVSATEHMEDFARGLVDLRPLVLYASGTVFALFLTTRIVESRKWR
jgi:ABC-2 type transport system permease protein